MTPRPSRPSSWCTAPRPAAQGWKRTGQFLRDDGHTVYRATLTGLGGMCTSTAPMWTCRPTSSGINLILFEDLGTWC